MSTGKVVLGTLAGLAIGAIAGILLAPEKGSKTRRQSMDKGDDYIDELKSKYEEFVTSINNKFESTKKDAQEMADKGKAKYDDAKKEMKNGMSDVKNAVS